MPGHMCAPPPPTHPESPGVLVTCSLLSFPFQSLPQQQNVWRNSPHHARPYISDPVVRDKVLSYLRGRQINLRADWWAVMQLSGLVRVQHHAVERPASKNRSQDLRGVDSSSSVIMTRVKLFWGIALFSCTSVRTCQSFHLSCLWLSATSFWLNL